MKFRTIVMTALGAAALGVPAALRAQEDSVPRPGMIGVVFSTSSTRSSNAPPEDGPLLISEVRPGSPAEQAGLREGDVVVTLNGRPSARALPLRLSAGDTVHVRLRRDGGEQDVVVVAARRPREERVVFTREMGDSLRIAMAEALRSLDTLEVPLELLAAEIGNLHTQLRGIDSAEFRMHMDSALTILIDSLPVMVERFELLAPTEMLREVDIVRMRDGALRMRESEARMREGEARMREGTVRMRASEDRLRPMVTREPFLLELGRRGAAGAELAEMNEGLSRYFGNVRDGALVIDVSPATPAARAGLEPGDVIVRAAGAGVTDPEDVRRALMRADDGQVELEIVRQGRRRTLQMEWSHENVMIREMRPSRDEP